MIIYKEKFIVLAVSLAFSFLLYSNSINGNFVADDKLVILQNPLISGNFSDFGKAFLSPYYHNQAHAGLYRPFTVVSYNLNKIFSSGSFGFHFLNVILNAVNGFLVFLIVAKLTNKKQIAYLSTTLFLFLPIHSEAVSSIVGRAELLSFLFSALSLLFVLNKRYFGASIALLAGLLSKETAAGFFLVFLYLWMFYERQTLKKVFLNSLHFIFPIAVYVLLRVYVLGKYFISVDHLMAYNPLRFAPFFPSLWTSLKVFYLYLLKTVVPYELSFDYSFNQIPIIKNPFLYYEVYIGAALLIALIYLAIKKRRTTYGLSSILFLLVYLPVSNWLVKIGTIMGERLMYAPSLGLVMLGVIAVSDQRSVISNKIVKRLIYVGLAGTLIWYGYVIIDRNRDWKNESTLLKSGYETSSNSVVSITNMGFLAFGNGKYAEAGRWAEKALTVDSSYIGALFLAGHASKNLGNLKSAESYWLKLIKLSSNYTSVYLSLGILYYEQGKLDKAETVLEKGFNLERTWSKAFPLAIVKINLGKYDEAIKFIISNFGDKPEKRELKFALGLAYLKKGDEQKAEFYLGQVKDPSVSMEEYFGIVRDTKTFKINEY